VNRPKTMKKKDIVSRLRHEGWQMERQVARGGRALWRNYQLRRSVTVPDRDEVFGQALKDIYDIANWNDPTTETQQPTLAEQPSPKPLDEIPHDDADDLDIAVYAEEYGVPRAGARFNKSHSYVEAAVKRVAAATSAPFNAPKLVVKPLKPVVQEQPPRAQPKQPVIIKEKRGQSFSPERVEDIARTIIGQRNDITMTGMMELTGASQPTIGRIINGSHPRLSEPLRAQMISWFRIRSRMVRKPPPAPVGTARVPPVPLPEEKKEPMQKSTAVTTDYKQVFETLVFALVAHDAGLAKKLVTMIAKRYGCEDILECIGDYT
jgi:predicted RNA binding protein YcfA (HicA-like mRNA interferase family)